MPTVFLLLLALRDKQSFLRHAIAIGLMVSGVEWAIVPQPLALQIGDDQPQPADD